MNKVLQIGLVTLYVLLTGFCFLLLLALSGVYISTLTLITTLAGWLLFCFLSVYIRTPLHLFFYGRLRKPIREEQLRLEGCFADLIKTSGYNKKVHLRIAESQHFEAFTTGPNIIAFSKPLVDGLTDDELKGIMAHELGHLISKDTTISWAFITASDLPRIVRSGYRMIRSFVWRIISLAALVIVLLLLFKPLYLLPMMALMLFVLLFSLLDRLFRWLQLIVSRLCEYKQDAYAYQLGYGPGLKDALKKLAQRGVQQVNIYSILMTSTHPVIYNRIRRLEQLLFNNG